MKKRSMLFIIVMACMGSAHAAHQGWPGLGGQRGIFEGPEYFADDGVLQGQRPQPVLENVNAFKALVAAGSTYLQTLDKSQVTLLAKKAGMGAMGLCGAAAITQVVADIPAIWHLVWGYGAVRGVLLTRSGYKKCGLTEDSFCKAGHLAVPIAGAVYAGTVAMAYYGAQKVGLPTKKVLIGLSLFDLLCRSVALVKHEKQKVQQQSAPVDDRVEAFFDVIGEGDFAQVKALIDSGVAPLYAKDERGMTALMNAVFGEKLIDHTEVAVQRDYLAIMNFLIARGADVNEKDRRNMTALFYTVFPEDELAYAKCLIKAKADLEIKNEHGETVLYKAAAHNHLALVRELIAAGACVDSQKSDGTTPLSIAADNGYEEIVRVLLDAKADLNSSGVDGGTPLVYAVKGGHSSITKMLVNAGAELNWRDTRVQEVPLLVAAEHGLFSVVEYLIASGANVQIQDETGSTSLLYAAVRGDLQSLTALLNAGARKDVQNRWKNSALFFLTQLESSEDAIAGIKLLLAAPRNKTLLVQESKMTGNANDVKKIVGDTSILINMKNRDGLTALMAAADLSRPDVVQTLLSYPMVNKDLRNDAGETALDRAKKLRDYRVEAVQYGIVIDPLEFGNGLEVIALLEQPRLVCKRH